MATHETSHVSDFSVKLTSKSLIKAADFKTQPYTISVSNFDHLSGRYPVTIFYAYRRPTSGDISSIVAAIKSSLAEILFYFPSFAGRIVPNAETGDAEILCNNEGVELIEAHADVSLASINFYYLDKCMKKILLPYTHELPLSLQITGYTCGGFSISWSFDHLLGDASSFNTLILLWSDIARTKRISVVPTYDRSIFRPRSPPSYGPLLDRTFTVFTLEEILNRPPNDISIKRLYYIDGSAIDRLQEISASTEGGTKRRTRTEALSAYLWKVMARTLTLGETGSATTCKMAWLVDGRPWLGLNNKKLAMSNYVGYLVSMAIGEASAHDLEHGSLSHVAGIVSRAIGEVTNEAHFLDLLDWIECHRPGRILAKILLGLGGPAIVVSSCHHLPAMSMDFGFGPPRLGTYYSVAERLGVCHMSIIQSGKGDGSWTVFAFISPKLATALELDPDRVFQPITADHLGL